MFGKRKRDPRADPFSIGNLLIQGGYCTQDQIDEILEDKKKDPEMLMGQLLVCKGAITKEALELMLVKQKAANGHNSAIIRFAQIATRKAQSVTASIEALVSLEKIK